MAAQENIAQNNEQHKQANIFEKEPSNDDCYSVDSFDAADLNEGTTPQKHRVSGLMPAFSG